jgi:translocation and assembly module TamB
MTAEETPKPRRRLRRLLLWSGGALLVLLLLLGAAVWFLLSTQSGTRFLFTRLGALIPGSLEVAELTGPIRGPLDIRGLVYQSDGMKMTVDHLQLAWHMQALLSKRLDVDRLYADGIRIIPTPSKEPKKENSKLPDLNLRFNIALHDARVTHLQIGAPGEKPFVIDRVDLQTREAANLFTIERFTVRSPLADGDITGTFQPQGDYTVDLQAKWTVRPPGLAAAFAGNGALTGTLERLQVNQTLSAPFPARLATVLTEPLYDLRFDGRLVFSDMNPRLLKADLPDLPASGEVAIAGNVDTFSSSGTVRGNLRRAFPQVEGIGPVAVTYKAARDGAKWQIDSAAITLPGTAARIDASGLVTAPVGEPVTIDGKAAWQNVRWPLQGAPTVASARGTATVAGTLDAYRAEVQADLTQVPGGEIATGRWTLAGNGTQERFRFDRFQGTVLSGRINGRGEVAWKPQVRWNLALRGDGINPKTLAPDFAGNLAFEASTRGALSDAGPNGTVTVPRLRGMLRGQPVAGAADVELHGQRTEVPRLQVTWGTASVEANGRVAPTLDLAWQLSAPNLGIVIPQGGGSVLARGRVSGAPKTPRIEVHGQGQELRFGGAASTASIAAANVDGDVDLARGGPFTLDLHATDLRSGEQRLTELTVQGRGTQGSHTIATTALIQDGRLDVTLAGGISGDLSSSATWSGTIQRLDLTSKPTGTWRLGGPAPLTASAAAVQLRDFCLSGGLNGPGNARLCAAGGWAKAGSWDVNATIAGLPLDSFRTFLPTDLRITGDLNGKVAARGDFRGAHAVLAGADVDLRPGPGEIRFPGAEGKTTAFRYEQGFVRAQAGEGGAGHADAGLTLSGVGTMSANLQIPRMAPGTPLKSQPLAGRIDVNLSNLAFVEGFVPDLNRPAGTLAGGYALSGTVGSPRFVGEASLRDGQADVPRFGLKLRSFQLKATGDGSGALAIDGSLKSGPGTLTIKGRAGVPGPETPVRLALQGQRFQVSDTEEIRAQVSPDLTFTSQNNRMELTGDVTVLDSKVNIEKKPPKGPVKASQDVVFVNASAAAAPEKKMALFARVRLILGQNVQVAALGLNAKPTGSLLVIDEPRGVTRGVGEIEMTEGTFKAYGQDLTIERGRLIFNGPIDNPGLDVRAYRKADDGTTAGIEAKGTAQKPQVTLWSDPPMTQTEALAYLLLGHPLNQAQPEEGNLLANAATSLGLKGGNLLAKKLAARFGLEEARIEGGKELKDASLVVGKYLSPRLYVAYGVGLFEPVNTFRIRYLLNKKLTLQAERGTGVSADALYTVER